MVMVLANKYKPIIYSIIIFLNFVAIQLFATSDALSELQGYSKPD